MLVFATGTLGVLLLRRGHAQQAADLLVAAIIGRQDPQQALAVEPIGLRPARPAADKDAGGFHHMVAHAVREQPGAARPLRILRESASGGAGPTTGVGMAGPF